MAAELAALRRQGFVACEAGRSNRAAQYKLRFRVGGAQRVYYLRGDPVFIAQVRSELAELQAPMRRMKNLKRATREARRAIRAAKKAISPLLAGTDYHYHGLIIRRRRAKSVEVSHGPTAPSPAVTKENADARKR